MDKRRFRYLLLTFVDLYHRGDDPSIFMFWGIEPYLTELRKIALDKGMIK